MQVLPEAAVAADETAGGAKASTPATRSRAAVRQAVLNRAMIESIRKYMYIYIYIYGKSDPQEEKKGYDRIIDGSSSLLVSVASCALRLFIVLTTS